MITRVSWICLPIVLLGQAMPARAEVAVEKDEDGAYQALHVVTRADERGTRHWGRNADRPEDDVLNEAGDSLADGAPAAVVFAPGVIEDGATPLVVWSHKDGGDREIYYSIWRKGSGWRTPERITENSADDVEPMLLIDPRDDARLVWWTQGTTGSVWMDRYDGVWHGRKLESEADKDSRWPRLSINGKNELILSYSVVTREGTKSCGLVKDRFDP